MALWHPRGGGSHPALATALQGPTPPLWLQPARAEGAAGVDATGRGDLLLRRSRGRRRGQWSVSTRARPPHSATRGGGGEGSRSLPALPAPSASTWGLLPGPLVPLTARPVQVRLRDVWGDPVCARPGRREGAASAQVLARAGGSGCRAVSDPGRGTPGAGGRMTGPVGRGRGGGPCSRAGVARRGSCRGMATRGGPCVRRRGPGAAV